MATEAAGDALALTWCPVAGAAATAGALATAGTADAPAAIEAPSRMTASVFLPILMSARLRDCLEGRRTMYNGRTEPLPDDQRLRSRTRQPSTSPMRPTPLGRSAAHGRSPRHGWHRGGGAPLRPPRPDREHEPSRHPLRRRRSP